MGSGRRCSRLFIPGGAHPPRRGARQQVPVALQNGLGVVSRAVEDADMAHGKEEGLRCKRMRAVSAGVARAARWHHGRAGVRRTLRSAVSKKCTLLLGRISMPMVHAKS